MLGGRWTQAPSLHGMVQAYLHGWRPQDEADVERWLGMTGVNALGLRRQPEVESGAELLFSLS